MPQKVRASSHREYNKFLEKRGNIFHYGIKTKIPPKNKAAEHLSTKTMVMQETLLGCVI